MLAGFHSPADAQTYTTFDALPTGTWPTQIDSSGRIIGITRGAGQTGVVGPAFIRNADGSITLSTAPDSDWAGFSGASNIVGRYQDANYVEHGYVGPINGPFTAINVSGATGTYPTRSNASGQIVGYWTDSSNKLHGFLRSAAGVITKFDVPGAVTTQPEAINTSGQVAGVMTDSTGVLSGFIGTVGGTFTKYTFPAGTKYGSANLNDAGQITGYYADVNFNSKGYLRATNGTFTTLTEGGNVSAFDINQGGSIVGVMGGKYSGRKDGYMRRPDGTSVTIEYPGASFIVSSTKAIGINQTGVIMGQYQLTTQSSGDTVWHGFIVTGVH
jgi:hypothetical protein